MTAPEPRGRLTGRFLQRFLFQGGSPAPVTEGVLFKPMQEGTGIHGAWGDIDAQRRQAATSIGLVGLAALVGLLLARSGPKRVRPRPAY